MRWKNGKKTAKLSRHRKQAQLPVFVGQIFLQNLQTFACLISKCFKLNSQGITGFFLICFNSEPMFCHVFTTEQRVMMTLQFYLHLSHREMLHCQNSLMHLTDSISCHWALKSIKQPAAPAIQKSSLQWSVENFICNIVD